MTRQCDRCGKNMAPKQARKRIAGLFVCDGCHSLSPHWKDHDRSGFAKNAHDMSNDPMVITHCAFCGSGQVIARSDGSCECEYCNKVFTIRIEPYYPSWPQTINGVPQDIPTSPNMEETDDPMMGGEGLPGGDLTAPEDLDEDGDDSEFDDEESDEDEEDMPPFNSSLRTYMGDELPEDAYVRHLAILYAQDQDRVIDLISSEKA